MVATLHLHCPAHRIKYGNPEEGNTTQQFLSITRPYCSIESIESFLFWVIIITHNKGIYICIFIYKVRYIHSFFVIFSCDMKKYFVKLMSRLLHSTTHQVMWFFWMFIVNPLSILWTIFFLKKTVFLLVSLFLDYRCVNQPRYF